MRASYRRRYGGGPFGAFGSDAHKDGPTVVGEADIDDHSEPLGVDGKGPTSMLRTTFLVATSMSFTLWASCASPTRPATASSLPFGEKSRPPTPEVDLQRSADALARARIEQDDRPVVVPGGEYPTAGAQRQR